MFRGSGESNIDKKTIEKRNTNEFGIAPQLVTEKTSQKLPRLPQHGVRNRAKMLSKRLQKEIENELRKKHAKS